jgi:hypothetical protein
VAAPSAATSEHTTRQGWQRTVLHGMNPDWCAECQKLDHGGVGTIGDSGYCRGQSKQDWLNPVTDELGLVREPGRWQPCPREQVVHRSHNLPAPGADTEDWPDVPVLSGVRSRAFCEMLTPEEVSTHPLTDPLD